MSPRRSLSTSSTCSKVDITYTPPIQRTRSRPSPNAAQGRVRPGLANGSSATVSRDMVHMSLSWLGPFPWPGYGSPPMPAIPGVCLWTSRVAARSISTGISCIWQARPAMRASALATTPGHCVSANGQSSTSKRCSGASVPKSGRAHNGPVSHRGCSTKRRSEKAARE
jgi:hypothetical protein